MGGIRETSAQYTRGHRVWGIVNSQKVKKRDQGIMLDQQRTKEIEGKYMRRLLVVSDS